MYEIEAKVRINRKDLPALRKKVKKFAKYKGKFTKKDTYYGTENGFTLRLRQKEGSGAVLNIKSKKLNGGTESNQEVEIPVKSKVKFNRLLKKFEVPFYACKEKISEAYAAERLNIELNFVKGLGHFLEIEIIAKTAAGKSSAKRRLLKVFRSLGFSPEDFEKKYYLELLHEKGYI
jgi:predicted adenylyl cyclase CyaB